VSDSCTCTRDLASKNQCLVHGGSNARNRNPDPRIMEMKEQDRIWKERRMKSGHGAQDGSARDPNYKALIVFIGGPIKHWWDENWMSPEHIRYDEWRTKVEEACTAAGFLVFKPYTAWKGTWNEEAQEVNNTVIKVVDIFLNLCPDGVPSEGTDEEINEADRVGTPVLHYPPCFDPRDDDFDLRNLVTYLTQLADVKNAKIES
jgi:hypothetical protein